MENHVAHLSLNVYQMQGRRYEFLTGRGGGSES